MFGLGHLTDLVDYNKVGREAIRICIFRDPMSRIVSQYLWDMGYSELSKRTKSDLDFKSYLDIQIKTWSNFPTQTAFLEARKVSYDDIDIKFLVKTLPQEFVQFKREYSLQDRFVLEYLNKGESERKLKALNVLREDSEAQEMVRYIYKEDFVLYDRVRKEKGLI
jgi:hypothetical protein